MVYRGALLSLVAMLLLPAAAGATFAGHNGRLVVSVQGCGENEMLASLPWRGGPLRPLTPYCEPESEEVELKDFKQPDAAPDGSRLVAVQDAFGPHVVVMNADGSHVQSPLPQSGPYLDPSFARSGQRLLFSVGEDWLATSGLDGTGYRDVTPPCHADCITYDDPRMSPDGWLIAANVSARGDRRIRRPGLWLIFAENGRRIRRFATRGVRPDWAPGGKRIVYATRFGRDSEGDGHATGGNLYIVRRDGRQRRLLLHRERIAETNPVWSPDGRWVAWISLRYKGTGDVFFDVRASVWRMLVDGGRPTKVRSLPEPWVDEGEFDVPDLTWLPRP